MYEYLYKEYKIIFISIYITSISPLMAILVLLCEHGGAAPAGCSPSSVHRDMHLAFHGASVAALVTKNEDAHHYHLYLHVQPGYSCVRGLGVARGRRGTIRAACPGYSLRYLQSPGGGGIILPEARDASFHLQCMKLRIVKHQCAYSGDLDDYLRGPALLPDLSQDLNKAINQPNPWMSVIAFWLHSAAQQILPGCRCKHEVHRLTGQIEKGWRYSLKRGEGL